MLHLLEQQLDKKAHYSHDANSAFGIAFDILGLRGVTGSRARWFYLLLAAPIRAIFFRHHERFYVVEIDGERPHEAEFLASWLKPEVTLWISLGRSHAVQFESQITSGDFENIDKAICHEFAMLPQYTTKRIFIDSDSPLMVKAIEKITAKHAIRAETVKCSKSELRRYQVRPSSTEFTFAKNTFVFAAPFSRDLSIQLSMLIHLCEYLNMQPNSDFSYMPLPPGRNSFFEGRKGLKIIDSSYNAHLISLRAILEMFRSIRASHKWLIIGDMVEQGSIESEEHIALAAEIAKVKPEQVILLGRRTKKYTAPLLKEQNIPVFTTEDPREALEFIEKRSTGVEILLFKGSQYLEWIIEKLLKNPEDADKLPRREPAAVRRREKRGLY